MKYAKTVFCFLAVFLFLMPTRAHAYLDPGTGSVILQAIAAAVLGIGIFWRNIVSFFKKKKSSE